MIEIVRRKHDEMPLPIEVQEKLEAHFEEMHELLNQLGQRPFWTLELHMPNTHDGAVYRWTKPRTERNES